MNEEIIIPLSVFASIFGIFYIYLMTRNKERLALIEKGANADLFQSPNRTRDWPLKIGIMSIGVGLGIVVANILVSANVLEEGVAFPSMIFIFAGAGLVTSYLLTKDKKDLSK